MNNNLHNTRLEQMFNLSISEVIEKSHEFVWHFSNGSEHQSSIYVAMLIDEPVFESYYEQVLENALDSLVKTGISIDNRSRAVVGLLTSLHAMNESGGEDFKEVIDAASYFFWKSDTECCGVHVKINDEHIQTEIMNKEEAEKYLDGEDAA